MGKSTILRKKTALIIGHPGHELRIFRLLEHCQPRVYVLTDGSGYNLRSRLDKTENIFRDVGCVCSEIMGRFSDKTMYDLILSKDEESLRALLNEIVEDLKYHDIDMVMGDALEGFNPTHDLCRYLINSAVTVLDNSGLQISNYDFLLDGPPGYCPDELRDQAIWMDLDEDDIQRKLEAAENYPEIASDVTIALEKYGYELFKKECLRPVLNNRTLRNWQVEPMYEVYGRQRVASGKYTEMITFKEHMEPLGNMLLSYAQSKSL